MTLTFVFQGREATCILCDELFQIYKNFTKLRMLQATDVFPRARCIQDAVDKGVRGNVVPRPAPLSLLFRSGHLRGTRFPSSDLRLFSPMEGTQFPS